MRCYCGSELSFANCCQPFLAGSARAKTAAQLMRSRYSAYCIGSIDYIAATYHQSQQSAEAKAEIAAFAGASHFVSLTVLSAQQHSDQELPMPDNPYLASIGGISRPKAPVATAASDESQLLPAEGSLDYVHFIARFIMQDKLQQLEEKSRFIFEQQQWWYLDGCLLPHANQKINRNDLCPCGSGKKYKVCRPHLMSAQQP